MTKKEKKLWIEAIDALIVHYKGWEKDEIPESFGFTHPALSCPLCVASIAKGKIAVNCTMCLWVRFEGRFCTDRDNHGLAYSRYPTKDRLKRLRRWKRKIRGLK